MTKLQKDFKVFMESCGVNATSLIALDAWKIYKAATERAAGIAYNFDPECTDCDDHDSPDYYWNLPAKPPCVHDMSRDEQDRLKCNRIHEGLATEIGGQKPADDAECYGDGERPLRRVPSSPGMKALDDRSPP